MQRLSMIAFTAFAVLALSGAAFTKKAAPAQTLAPTQTPALAPTSARTSLAKKNFVNYYYWYSAFDGSYNDYEPLDYEINEMEIWYDCPVDQIPYDGGTLIEKGFTINNPNLPVNVFLYAHFDY